MNSEEKEVFRKIAGCSIANRIIDDLEARNPIDEPYKSCEKICLHQKEKFDGLRNEQVRFSKETFHMPEPWNGNLSKAEILFVSSNPSFDINETTPELARKENKEVLPKIISDPDKDDPETKRALDEAENFFENRFSHKEYKNKTWTSILKHASYLLEKTSPEKTSSIEPIENITKDQKDKIASSIALTEVVHCKSEGEKGVQEALETCYNKHTRAVIELFLKSPSGKSKTVVLLGNHARNAFHQALEIKSDKAIPKNQLEQSALDEFGEISHNTRFSFICIPHPNAQRWNSWKTGVTYNSLSDEVRQQIIDDELKGQ